jgi:outer membrane protein assembly factor BamB
MKKYLFFLLVLFCMKTAYAEGENDPNFKEINTGAMAVVEQGNIFSEPSKSSSLKGKFKLGDCFLVIGAITEPVQGGKNKTGVWKWVKIQTLDKSIKGWVAAGSIQEPDSWKPDEKNDWIQVRYNIAANYLENAVEAEKILNQLLKQFPKHKIPITDDEEGSTTNTPLSELVPEKIAMLYSASKQYDVAIQKYALLAKKKKSKDEEANYYYEIVRILENDDKDDFKTKENWYWKIINEEPSVAVSGDEWNDWVDSAAASGLVKMKRAANDEKALGVTGVALMNIGKNFRVYILGAEAKIESLMSDNQYTAAKNLLLKTYQKYPTGISGYFKSDINSTLLIFGAYLNGFDHSDPSRAQKLTAIKELEDMQLDPAVENYIAYQKLVTLDDGPGLKDDLSVPVFTPFYLEMEWYLTGLKYYDKSRLERIKATSNFSPYQAVLTDDTLLSLSHDLQDKSIKLSKGTQVTVAYEDSSNDLAKVKTAEGKIGWLNKSIIAIAHSVPFSPVVPQANYWPMVGGNPGRSYFVPENPIKNPILLRRIPYFHSDEPLVVDVDGDQRADIVTNDLNGNLNVIRGDGKGILFTIKDFPTLGVPTYMNDNLLVMGDRGFPDTATGKSLECVGVEGTKKWQASVVDGNSGLYPEGAYVFNDKVYTDRMTVNGSAFQCFDLTTGKELWSYSYCCSLDFKPLFQGNLAIFSVEHNFADADKMVVLDLDTQKVMCEISKPKSQDIGGPANSVLVSSGLIVFRTFEMIKANRVLDGKEIWSVTIPQTRGNQAFNNMASDGKSLFVFNTVSNVMFLTCYDLASGKVIWTTTGEQNDNKWPKGRMSLVNGALYYYNGSALVALDIQTGNELWELALPSPGDLGAFPFNVSVVPAAGQIVVSAGNTLFIVGEKPKLEPQ